MDKHLNDSYKLRIPAELKARVAESAKAHNRSMNADIVARLEKSFEQGEISPAELISEVIGLNRLVDRLDETINILNERLKSLESKTPN